MVSPWMPALALALMAVVLMMLCTMPAEAIRLSRFQQDPASSVPASLFRFKEAPAFRNGEQCIIPVSSSNGGSEGCGGSCDPAMVHIAMTLDAQYLRGSIAAVFSILQHASCPTNVFFHFLVSRMEAQLLLQLQSLVQATFPYLKFKVYLFDPDRVQRLISSSVRQALEQPLNYARNYLADMLEPCVERVIYLDSDLVVVDDVSKLWRIGLGEYAIGAPEYCHTNFSKYFSDAFWSDPELRATFHGRRPCYFNTGVMVMDLRKWRAGEYTQRLEMWMEVQKEKRIYELGSLPPFLLVFAGRVQAVEHRWNQHGLGGDNVVGGCRSLHPGPVSLLHWSGKSKPWLRLHSDRACSLDSIWAAYDLYLPPSSSSAAAL